MSLHDIDDLDRVLGLEQVNLVTPDEVRLTYRVLPRQCHSGGVAQGGFVCGWIDAAMSRLLRAIHGEAAITLTLDLHLSFLQPTRPGLVTAWARPLQVGRSIAFVEGDLRNEDQILAKATATFKVRSMRKAQ